MAKLSSQRHSALAGAFGVLTALCVAFVLLTGGAMLLYSGGSRIAPDAPRYSFTLNFFSDLGRERLFDGTLNSLPRVLFTLALSFGGGALGVFFLVFATLFRRTVPQSIVAFLGATVGLVSGACFVGVGWTPADVLPYAHGTFVLWAFRLFLLAVVLFSALMALDARYPRLGLAIFVGFGGLLLGYLWLLSNGPSSETASGLLIQVGGQKVIIYAALGAVGVRRIPNVLITGHQAFFTREALENIAATTIANLNAGIEGPNLVVA